MPTYSKYFKQVRVAPYRNVHSLKFVEDVNINIWIYLSNENGKRCRVRKLLNGLVIWIHQLFRILWRRLVPMKFIIIDRRLLHTTMNHQLSYRRRSLAGRKRNRKGRVVITITITITMTTIMAQFKF